MSHTPSIERRLSQSGNNAYISVMSMECKPTTSQIRDDSAYLSVRPIRANSLSPQLLSNALNKCKQREENVTQANSDVNATTPAKTQNEKNVEFCKGTLDPTQSSKTNKIQTGMDRYILVTKRKASSRSPRKEPKSKISKGNEVDSENRYSILGTEENEETQPVRQVKPPPIYLREQTSNVLVNKLSQLLGKDQFYVTSLRRGNVSETKVQTYNEELYMKLVKFFDAEKKNYYTYQLKSSKGLVVVIKGIDSSVPIDEIKTELDKEGYEVKSIINIINKNKIPQPMFKVELTFESSIVKKKGATHPIYDLRYLCSRRIRVEEPLKRTDPPQCTNCQEFGHTKTYCKLPSVCVRCGDIHKTVECPHPKSDSSVKKCSNCGENHTANYRGCQVYIHMKNSNKNNRNPVYAKYAQTHLPGLKTIPPMVSASEYVSTQTSSISNSQNRSYASMLRNGEPAPSRTPIESSIEKFIETMNSFMTNMQSMMQEMMKNQSLLMQLMLQQK